MYKIQLTELRLTSKLSNVQYERQKLMKIIKVLHTFACKCKKEYTVMLNTIVAIL